MYCGFFKIYVSKEKEENVPGLQTKIELNERQPN